MRKTVLFAAICTATLASAQTGEITSNRGENWLSQDGDWGLTFDANPLLNYAGNLFNGSSENSIGSGLTDTWSAPWSSYNSSNGVVIGGKKLIDANTAYRAKLRIGFGSQKSTILVDDVANTTDPLAMVDDVEKVGHFDIVIGAGMEKRVGSTRIVGVYGAEVMIAMHSAKNTYEYGNALTATNTGHTNSFGQGAGVTEVKGPGNFGLGLGVFGGVEWFAAPKLSLCGEYTWGLWLVSQGHTSTTTEAWNGTAAESNTIDGGTKHNDFSLDTGVSGANIGVNFYFQ